MPVPAPPSRDLEMRYTGKLVWRVRIPSLRILPLWDKDIDERCQRELTPDSTPFQAHPPLWLPRRAIGPLNAARLRGGYGKRL